MFRDIENIKTTRVFKKTKGDYIKYRIISIVTGLISFIFIVLIIARIPSLKDSVIMLFMVFGFLYSWVIIRKEWTHNFEFSVVSNSLNENENHKLILNIVRKLNLEIIDNNIHRTIVVAKGKTSTLSIGSILTFVYSEQEILINSRPIVGDFSSWPFYRTDINTVLEEINNEHKSLRL